MKQDIKNDHPPAKSSGWLALIALLALGFSAAAYSEVHRSLTVGAQDEAMLVQLNEVAHLHIVLSELGKGHSDAARAQLKAKLADDLAAVQPLAADSDTAPAHYARTLLASIDRYEKAHPDYYLSARASNASAKPSDGQAGSQMAASRVTTH